MEKKVPMRTCIACRKIKPKRELVRIVKSENGILLDRTGKLNGRGAYICEDVECLKKLKKSKGLNRAFSCEVDESVYSAIEEEFLGTKE